VGFNVGPGWLVGYGLDDREALRNLPGLCVLED
ncbi:MAG: hypoxanthine phosphoribosyltransferase, partial [Acidobacteriota bacterium]